MIKSLACSWTHSSSELTQICIFEEFNFPNFRNCLEIQVFALPISKFGCRMFPHIHISVHIYTTALTGWLSERLVSERTGRGMQLLQHMLPSNDNNSTLIYGLWPNERMRKHARTLNLPQMYTGPATTTTARLKNNNNKKCNSSMLVESQKRSLQIQVYVSLCAIKII